LGGGGKQMKLIKQENFLKGKAKKLNLCQFCYINGICFTSILVNINKAKAVHYTTRMCLGGGWGGGRGGIAPTHP
jgi:hypothetical protein